MKTLFWGLGLTFVLAMATSVTAADLKVGESAPGFSTKTHEGVNFDLKSRKGQWTVLYFYPKADTPGCTKQACAFRDSIKKIRAQGGDVFGVSADTVDAQAAFHKKHKLNFILLADPDSKIIGQYGTKMADGNLSRRWTFIIGPDLKIKMVMKEVDPVLDSEKVATHIAKLKETTK